jgi:hypothetical protein
MQDEDFEPVVNEIDIPKQQLGRLQASLKTPTILLERLQSALLWLPKKMVTWWQVLHSNQKLYLIAVILGIAQEDSISRETITNPEFGVLVVGSIAMIGMLRELLDIFTRVWQTLLGKSLIFIIYVIIGNFTLAVAARKVNYIAGVDPDTLIYAQGFTTVLVLPLWLLLLTSMSLILLFTLGNVWFLFLKLVNLLRLHPVKFRAGERFSVLFVFIRLSLISPIMVTLIQPLNWYNTELNIEIPGITINTGLPSERETKELTKEEEGKSEQEAVNNTEGQKNRASVDNANENIQTDIVININAETSEAKVKYTDFDRAIATFVYEYETFQLSRCEKSSSERVSIIGEDVILVAEKMPEHELGYKFSARACQLRDYKE